MSHTNDFKDMPIIKFDMVPGLESDYQRRMKESGKMFINSNAPPRYPKRP
jgi:hypothetical protein